MADPSRSRPPAPRHAAVTVVVSGLNAAEPVRLSFHARLVGHAECRQGARHRAASGLCAIWPRKTPLSS
jgi:hypothetical protein